jgi:hypothetical protein
VAAAVAEARLMTDQYRAGAEAVAVRYLAPSAADMPIFAIFCQVMSVVYFCGRLLRQDDVGEPVPADRRATVSNMVLSSTSQCITAGR